MQRRAALDQLVVAARHLPGAVDAPVGAVRLERHQLDVLGRGLEVVEQARGFDRVAERRMLGDVARELAVDVDGPAVLERLDVLRPGLAGGHGYPSPTVSYVERRAADKA
jgi:hypothetical protein